jgi:hypothetical protein
MLLMLLALEALAFGADVACGVDVPVWDQVAVLAVVDPLPQRELGSRSAL